MPPFRISRARRATFFTLVGLGTLIGTWMMAVFLAEDGLRWLELALIAVFIPLYYQLNVGFWTALTGVWVQNRPGDDPLDLWKTLGPEDHQAPINGSTAIIMPIDNEDVTRVFEGLRAIYESLQKTGSAGQFDFFILSDSDDPNKWIEEEVAWLEL